MFILAGEWSTACWCTPSTIDSGIRAAASCSRFDEGMEPIALCAEHTAALERQTDRAQFYTAKGVKFRSAATAAVAHRCGQSPQSESG